MFLAFEYDVDRRLFACDNDVVAFCKNNTIYVHHLRTGGLIMQHVIPEFLKTIKMHGNNILCIFDHHFNIINIREHTMETYNIEEDHKILHPCAIYDDTLCMVVDNDYTALEVLQLRRVSTGYLYATIPLNGSNIELMTMSSTMVFAVVTGAGGEEIKYWYHGDEYDQGEGATIEMEGSDLDQIIHMKASSHKLCVMFDVKLWLYSFTATGPSRRQRILEFKNNPTMTMDFNDEALMTMVESPPMLAIYDYYDRKEAMKTSKLSMCVETDHIMIFKNIILLWRQCDGKLKLYQIEPHDLSHSNIFDEIIECTLTDEMIEKNIRDPNNSIEEIKTTDKPYVTTYKAYTKNRPGVEHECNICLETYLPEDKIVVRTCNHISHLTCAQHWARQQNTCPMCRNNDPRKFRFFTEYRQRMEARLNEIELAMERRRDHFLHWFQETDRRSSELDRYVRDYVDEILLHNVDDRIPQAMAKLWTWVGQVPPSSSSSSSSNKRHRVSGAGVQTLPPIRFRRNFNL